MSLKKFITDHVIPVSQLAELFHRAPVVHAARDFQRRHVELVQDTLNLVVLWAPGAKPAQLKRAVKPLKVLTDALLFALRPPPDPTAGLRGVLGLQKEGPWLTTERSDAEAYATLIGALVQRSSPAKLRLPLVRFMPELKESFSGGVAALHEVIGYSPSLRGRWLAAKREAFQPWSAQPHRWRTLARNSSWQRCVELLGLQNVAPPLLRLEDVFGSHPGQTQLDASWAKLARSKGTHAEAAVAEPVAEDLALPAGVSLSTSAFGVVTVRAEVDPRKGFGSKRLKELLAELGPTLPADLDKTLALRVQETTTPWRSIEKTVQAAVAWQEGQRKAISGLEAELVKRVQVAKHAALRARFEAAFSAEERQALASVLGAPADIVIVPAAAKKAPARKAPARRKAVGRVSKAA